MNDVFQLQRRDISADFMRCEECGCYELDELIALVVLDGVEMEMCYECQAMYRESGRDIQPV